MPTAAFIEYHRAPTAPGGDDGRYWVDAAMRVDAHDARTPIFSTYFAMIFYGARHAHPTGSCDELHGART